MGEDGHRHDGAPVAEPCPGRGHASLLSRAFTAETVSTLRRLLAAQVAAAGLRGETGEDFVLAVHELVTNAVRHGGGAGRLDLVRRDDVLLCEVTDHGGDGADLTVGRPAPDVPGGRGLWLAHHLTDALTLTRRPDGVTASVAVSLASPGPAAGLPRQLDELPDR